MTGRVAGSACAGLLGGLAGLGAAAAAPLDVVVVSAAAAAVVAVGVQAGIARRRTVAIGCAALVLPALLVAGRIGGTALQDTTLGIVVATLAAVLSGQDRARLGLLLATGPLLVLLARAPAAVPTGRVVLAGAATVLLLALLPDPWGTRPTNGPRTAAGALIAVTAVGALVALVAVLAPLPAPPSRAVAGGDPDAVLLDVPADSPDRWRLGALQPSGTPGAASFTAVSSGEPTGTPGSGGRFAAVLPQGVPGGVLPAPPGRLTAVGGPADVVVGGTDGLLRTGQVGAVRYAVTVEPADVTAADLAGLTFADVDSATAGLAGQLPAPLAGVVTGTSPADRAASALAATAELDAGPADTVLPALTDDRLVAVLQGSPAGPFELAAVRARLAVLAGLPARVAVGLAGGEVAGDRRLLRPRDRVYWTELRLADGTWAPVAVGAGEGGGSATAEQAAGTDGVSLLAPVRRTEPARVDQQVRAGLLAGLATAAGLALMTALVPLGLKARRRRARQVWAARAGPRQRVAVSYCELRDLCTDLGSATAATPGAFLARLHPDPEHNELAALVTRALWGPEQQSVGRADADRADALERSLRRRLLAAQPFERAVAARLSWASLRRPWTDELPGGVGTGSRVGTGIAGAAGSSSATAGAAPVRERVRTGNR